MGRVNTPILSELERTELENLYKKSDNHALRKRCQTILLKADGRKSKDVGTIVGMSHISVNSWLSRYKSDGIAGLSTKPGRGPKRKIDLATDGIDLATDGIDLATDGQAVLALAKKHRQKVESARAEWEAASGKRLHRETFRRFLKSLAVDTNE